MRVNVKYFFGFLILAFLVIISVSGVYSASLGLSKAELSFVAEINQEVCKEISIFSGERITVTGEDRWNIRDTKNLNDYTLDSNELDIIIDYPSGITFNKKETFDVCITGKENGRYYGVLIFKGEESVGVGTWLEVVIGNGINPNLARFDENTNRSSSVVLTGSSVEETGNENNLGVIFIFSSLLLVAVFIALISIYIIKRKRNKVV